MSVAQVLDRQTNDGSTRSGQFGAQEGEARYFLILTANLEGVTSFNTLELQWQNFRCVEETEIPTVVPKCASAPSMELRNLRRISGLTWEQLSRAISVTRRALHFWVNGGSISDENTQKIYKLVQFLRRNDRGEGAGNRRALMSPGESGETILDLLSQGSYEKAATRMRQMPIVEPNFIVGLSKAGKASRRPPRPATLLGANNRTSHAEEPLLGRYARNLRRPEGAG